MSDGELFLWFRVGAKRVCRHHRWKHMHFPVYMLGKYAVDVHNRRVNGPIADQSKIDLYTRVYLHHYWSRSAFPCLLRSDESFFLIYFFDGYSNQFSWQVL